GTQDSHCFLNLGNSFSIVYGFPNKKAALQAWQHHRKNKNEALHLSELVNPSHPVFDIEQFPKHTKVIQGSFEDYQRSYGDKYAFVYVNGIPR
ncbi:16790_t:CDS:2, partial [Gigaspora margarita]